jgi:branched-chain amino acid aminotransferase
MGMLDIKIMKTTNPKEKPKENQPLGFGKIFTDHMFIMNYTEGKGWHDARIVPFENLSLSPAAMVYHYGQEMFEGLKAYRTEQGKAVLFRPEMNARRANNTNKRLCIPEIEVDDYVQAVKAVVKVDEDWIPTATGTSLYIRPFVIATEEYLGVKPSSTYLFIIILSPSAPYYSNGINPISIWIEDQYVRAVRGGIGEAKTGGNYVASYAAQIRAENDGYAQVLWLDGVERIYIEEVGSMNIFFKIDGVVVTPELNGSILPGVTRNSVIELCKSWGLKVEERKLSIDEIYEAQHTGKLEEIWGTGTAAVISPIGKLRWKDEVMTIQDGCAGELSRKIYDTITGIQLGKVQDTKNWVVEVK